MKVTAPPLMAGKPIDDYLSKKGHEVFEPGNLK